MNIDLNIEHSNTVLELQFSDVKHGKGLWKFNNSLLHDINYINCINEKIDEIIRQYCLPVYDIEYVLNMNRSQIKLIINDKLLLRNPFDGDTWNDYISFSSYRAK